jgi:CheY-like chemotaxis protein
VSALILAVDDNEAHRYALVRTLEYAGYTVRHAGSAAEAFAVVQREHPDLVLLDVHLPDGNGFEICRRLKDDPATRDILVIMHTATWTGPLHAHIVDCGANAFLTYPIQTEHLTSVVEGTLARAASQ